MNSALDDMNNVCIQSSSELRAPTLDNFVKRTDGNALGSFFSFEDSNHIMLSNPSSDWINGIVWYQNTYESDTNVYGSAICKPQSGDNNLYKVLISGTPSNGFTSTQCMLIDEDSALKVTYYSVNLQNMTWSNNYGTYTFNLDVSGSIVGCIPVVEFSGNKRFMPYIRSTLSSSMASVDVELALTDNDTTPTYGTYRLYVFYKS